MLAQYFPAFLEFFFPAAYHGIDWSRNYTLLDKELHKVTRDAALGQRRAFPVVSLSAYRSRWAELESSANPFAVMTQAHLQARETAGLDEARYRVKRELSRSLYRRGYQRPAVLDLLRFVDWVLALPEGLENQLWAEVQQFEEEKHMRYVSSLEQIAIRKGIEQGIEKGIEQGIEKGREQTLCELLEELLVTRFGPLSETVRSRLAGANSAQLSLWFRRALTAPSLESVFAGEEG